MNAFEFPPEFRTSVIATNGTSIYVRSGGTGPAVVLLHGYGETGDMWAPMAVDLVRDHTVVVPEGFNMFDVAAAFESAGLGPRDEFLNLARNDIALISDLDPEARTALHAVRGAEVGVYKLRAGHKELKRAVILSVADKAMARRGWDRIVGVMNQGEFVAIYVRHDARSTRNVRVCLLTLNGEGMVVASARSNLEPLMEMAFKRVEWRQKGRIPIQL